MPRKIIHAQGQQLPNNLAGGRTDPLVDVPLGKDTYRLRKLLRHRGVQVVVNEMRKSPSNVARVTHLLADSNLTVKTRAAEAMKEAAEKKADISVAVPILAAMLECNSTTLVNHAFNALKHAAKNGINIASAVPFLTNRIFCEQPELAKTSREMIIDAAKGGACIADALWLAESHLLKESISKKRDASAFLLSAAKNGIAIRAAIPALSQSFLGDDEDVAVNSARTLGFCAEESAVLRDAISKLYSRVYQKNEAALADMNAKDLGYEPSKTDKILRSMNILLLAAVNEKSAGLLIAALADASKVMVMAEGAFTILSKLAERKFDISPAIPELVAGLVGGHRKIVNSAYGALTNLVDKGDEGKRQLLVYSIISLTQGNEFGKNAEYNTEKFEESAFTISSLLERIREKELKEAA